MMISLFQMKPVRDDVAANLAQIERAAASASAMGASLLITPELSVSGYFPASGFEAMAEPRDGAIIARLSQIARDAKLIVIAGFPELSGDVVYNTVVAVRPDAAPVFYRKCHLYGPYEKAAFAASDVQCEIFEIGGGLKAGMLICYDVEFPETVRGLALKGADVVLVPTALAEGKSGRHTAQILVPARAMENGVFVAYADLCGNEGDLAYEGRSVIAAPDGDCLARAGMEEALLFARLDPSVYAAFKATIPYLEDRRPELYGGLLG